MSKTGPRTPDGIAVVTRNLPPPEKSGPRTPRGKRISALNSLKHGLAAKGFLRCKKETCYFYEVCLLQNTEEGIRILDSTDYGDPCPAEMLCYYDVRHGLAREGIGDESWSHAWAMNEVYMMRRRMLSAVDVHLVRQVPAGCAGYVRPEPAVALRYQDRLHNERDVLVGMLAQLNE